MIQVGERVGAISHIENDTVYLFGYGISLGDKIPDPEFGIKFMGQPMNRPNPCIQLDNGDLVYGCECWWGNEEVIRDKVSKYANVVQVDIKQERTKYE